MGSDYDIECLAMAIVNHINEINGVSAKTRQDNNDKCFDYARDKIEEYIKSVVHTPLFHFIGEGP